MSKIWWHVDLLHGCLLRSVQRRTQTSTPLQMAHPEAGSLMLQHISSRLFLSTNVVDLNRLLK